MEIVLEVLTSVGEKHKSADTIRALLLLLLLFFFYPSQSLCVCRFHKQHQNT